MKLRLSKMSVDIDSIRAIRWNIEESGIDHGSDGKSETRKYWRRTWIYFKDTPKALTINDYDPNYEEDVEKLEQAWHPE